MLLNNRHEWQWYNRAVFQSIIEGPVERGRREIVEIVDFSVFAIRSSSCVCCPSGHVGLVAGKKADVLVGLSFQDSRQE